MKSFIGLIVYSLILSANGQIKLNLSIQTPPINDAVFNGKFLKAYQLYEYSSQRNFISPGIEFDNLFLRGTDDFKLHGSLGFYYASSDFIGVYGNYDQNQLVSEIKTKVINIPFFVRGSIKISELIDNNRMGIELGVVTTAWIKYDLSEIASIKSLDVDGNVNGETIYQDRRNLVDGLGDKLTYKAVGGVFVYVNRFYLSFRMDLYSIGDLYVHRVNQAWNIPAKYSFYQLSHKEGRMKRTYSSITLSFRLTR
ncbi:MAG: hypothetical protein JJE09_02990 [Bacteroidia bacterium]|nr:hypothetical protein [Bacteroidia bacterium]